MSQKYIADLLPLNASQIGHAAHGKAEFEVTEDELLIHIEMHDTPANTQHWEHFHGFQDGRAAQPATSAQDVNHDGFVDLPETGAVSGTTMVPFDAAPHCMNIPNDTYPVADAQGNFSYNKKVPLEKLKASFKKAFGTDELQLDKRVVYVHGVADDLKLPETVAGVVGHYDQHVTLPIATGKIKKVVD